MRSGVFIWNSWLSGQLMGSTSSAQRIRKSTTIILSPFGVQPLVVAIPWDENNNSNSDF